MLRVYTAAVVAGIVGLLVGMAFPDLDLRFAQWLPRGIIQHRSLLTHGMLVPLGLFVLAHEQRRPGLRLLAMGFSIGVAVHLCFDLYPSVWRGTALLHVPFVGMLAGTTSMLWMLAGIVGSLCVVFALMRNTTDLGLGFAGLIGAFASLAKGEFTFWQPLIILVVACAVAWYLAFVPFRQQLGMRDRV
jgi:hypothetical protein